MHDADHHASDADLLRRFARARDEAAFAELVRRHLGLVHSAAARIVGGDAHLAQDVAQSVFIDLARKAGALAHRPTLTGWLHTSTHHAAANAVRALRRRRQREEVAQAMHENNSDSARDAPWAQVRPVLDDALHRLRPADRDTLLLRFFEGRSFADLGALLALTESGARMRVDRALEKLRAQLRRRGIASTAAALATALSAHAIAVPPAGLATAVTAGALAGTTAAATSGALLTFLGMTKIQTAFVAALAVTGGATLLWQQHEQSRLHAVIDTREKAAAALARITFVAASVEPASASDRRAELQKLRTERDALAEQQRQFSARTTAVAQAAPATKTAGRAATGAESGGDEQVFDLRELDVMPKPAAQKSPVYPFEMKRAGIPGEAVVSFVVAADGSVTDIAPEDATHPLFAVAAMDAVAQWKFSPARKNGKPVRTRVQQSLSFRFSDQAWFSP